MNDINVPIQEEVDNKKVLEESAEKLAVIASKLAEIFKAGFDAGFIGDKTKALLEAYKQDAIDYIDEQIDGITEGKGLDTVLATQKQEIIGYIDEQLDFILTGEDSDGILETIKEISTALNDDAAVFTTLSNMIAAKVSSKANDNVGSSSRLYAVNNDGDHLIAAYSLCSENEAAEGVTKDINTNYQGTVVRRSASGTASIQDPERPKHIANKKYVDAQMEAAKSASVPSQPQSARTTSTQLYAVTTADGDHTVMALPLYTNDEAADTVTVNTNENYKGTIIKRSPIGTASVMNPINPKNIANKEYVDAEIAKVLYDFNYIPASIKSFNHDIGDVEVGQKITSVVLTWSLAGTKIKTLSLTGTGISSAITDNALTNKAISVSITADTPKGSWTLAITGEKGETATKPISSPTFKRRVYYGVSDSDSLDATGVTALSSFLATSRGYTWTPSCSDQYIYYCVPESFGEAAFKSGVFDGGFNPKTIDSITNAHGHTEKYYIYRSTEKITGSIAITVS